MLFTSEWKAETALPIIHKGPCGNQLLHGKETVIILSLSLRRKPSAKTWWEKQCDLHGETPFHWQGRLHWQGRQRAVTKFQGFTVSRKDIQVSMTKEMFIPISMLQWKSVWCLISAIVETKTYIYVCKGNGFQEVHCCQLWIVLLGKDKNRVVQEAPF